MQIVKNFNAKTQSAHKLIVLLAEKHPLTAKIQKNGLEAGGFQVYIVKSQEGLLSTLKKQKIDLLMIDANFNKKGDLSFIAKIKKLSLNPQIKIILTQVVPPKIIVPPSIKTKIDHFIVNPIPQARLIQELKKLTSQATRQAERVSLKLVASISFGDQKYKTRLIDVSSTGVHIENKNHKLNLQVGHVLKIEIELPKYKNPINFSGILVRLTKEGFGVKILNISKENKSKLCKSIEKYFLSKNAEIYYL